MHPLIRLKRATSLFLIVLLGFFWLGLLPKAQAVSPPPDGGYGVNTAEGTDALFSLTTGVWNTAVGFQALYADTTGLDNTATGGRTLFSNTTGSQNTANGAYALFYNTGSSNSAFGWGALAQNTTGTANTAIGYGALQLGTNGAYNVAIGWQAFWNLNNNTTGNDNVAVGSAALWHGSTGDGNIAIGRNALDGRAVGPPGAGNIALGAFAGHYTSGDNNIVIGNDGGFGQNSNAIKIGNFQHTATYIAGIYGATASGGTAVYINSAGQLGTMTSSARFKQNIRSMGGASDVLLALHPVAFQYKREIDSKGIPQFGLVAEEVEKVNPDLVVRDADGKPYTVRYEAVNAMLLNEFLKEHKKVQQLEKQVATLTAGLQKVSAQLEVSKPAPQTVLNNQ